MKRKQLERLRQRSDWFLSPETRERNNSRKGKGKGEGSLSLFTSNNSGKKIGNNGSNNNLKTTNMTPGSTGLALQQKNSGNSIVTKASSEGAVLEAFSDGDSVFTDTTSRSESPASEPVWSHILKVHSRDIIHSDTLAELSLPANYAAGSGADLSIDSHDIALGTDAFFAPIPLATEERGPSLGDIENDVPLCSRTKDGDACEDDEDNTTPTGMQDEEDTLLTCSQPSGGETDCSPRSEATDKDLRLPQRQLVDTPTSCWGEGGEEVLPQSQGEASVRCEGELSECSLQQSEKLQTPPCLEVVETEKLLDKAEDFYKGQQLNEKEGELVQSQSSLIVVDDLPMSRHEEQTESLSLVGKCSSGDGNS